MDDIHIAPYSRELGRVRGEAPGATLIAVGGVHGNEPAGLEAGRRVLARLRGARLRGELVVLGGNLAALQRGARYQRDDLNRRWTDPRVEALRARPLEDLADEDHEQRGLLEAIESALGRARGRGHLADLHTTSAEGIPFVLFGDTLAQRRFVQAFPLPVIIGLEEQVDGTLAEYWTRRGCVTFTVEGGQHAAQGSVDNLEAALWLALARAEMINPLDFHEVARAHARLDAQRAELPRVMEVVSRRAITADDAFRMEPGFRNIHPARAGQRLARDRRGDIVAPEDGLVILPLYQGLGSDGFFWGRTVSETRLAASRVLRQLGADRLLDLLPGVDRDPEAPGRFRVNTRVARLYPLEVFHLFGYRRVREAPGALTVERQPDRGHLR